MHYTDLQIDMESLLSQGRVEDKRALLMKIIYQNRTGQDILMTLPDHIRLPFPQGDTIHLCISRKYAQQNLDSLLIDSGVHKLASSHCGFCGSARTALQFGVDLLVLAADSGTVQPGHAIAEEIWR